MTPQCREAIRPTNTLPKKKTVQQKIAFITRRKVTVTPQFANEGTQGRQKYV